MKKIKISELPLYQSLIGLYTIGTDANNRSVKVSLEYIQKTVNEAVSGATDATAAAEKVTELCDVATKNAETAAKDAISSTAKANIATENANAATEEAKKKATLADEAASNADKSAENAAKAQAAAEEATKLTEEATEAAKVATEATEAVTEEMRSLIDKLIPTGIEVKYNAKLTFGNTEPNYITVQMIPSTTMKNIIFISDNKSVEVGTDGSLTVVGLGSSRIMVIPTLNTALAKTVIIEVSNPTLRLVNNRSTLRFTSSGALRLN